MILKRLAYPRQVTEQVERMDIGVKQGMGEWDTSAGLLIDEMFVSLRQLLGMAVCKMKRVEEGYKLICR